MFKVSEKKEKIDNFETTHVRILSKLKAKLLDRFFYYIINYVFEFDVMLINTIGKQNCLNL